MKRLMEKDLNFYRKEFKWVLSYEYENSEKFISFF